MEPRNQYLEKAKALFEQGNSGRAKRIAATVLRNNPGFSEALDLLGSIEMQRGNLRAARPLFEEAVKGAAKDPGTLCKLGFCLRGLKDTEKSLAVFLEVLDLDPENFNALFAAAGIYITLGEIEKAQEYLEKAVADTPPNLEPFRLLATLTPKAKDPAFLKGMLEFRKNSGDYSAENRSQLEFAIASACLAQGDQNGFTAHVKAANALLTNNPGGWYPANKLAFDLSHEIFTKDLVKSGTPIAEKKFTPIFIVGLPRSGSTLTEQILASHSKVYGADELPFIRQLFVEDMTRHFEMVYPKFFPNLPEEDKVALARAYQDKVQALSPESPFVVDKMVGNSFFIGAIKMILPWAKVIHVKRHPADTALSMYSSYFAPSVSYANDLPELARYFRMHAGYMALWEKVCPGFVHSVKYEDLVKDLEGESKKIFKFCGLEWEPSCLDFHATKRAVGTLSAGQVRKKVYTSSIGNWKKHKDLLKPFTEAVQDLLKDYGY